MKETKYCPVNAWDCPYFKDEGVCSLENPSKECDDYYAICGEEED